MKNALFLLTILLSNFISHAQNNTAFGFFEPDRSVLCITSQQRTAIENDLTKSQNDLIQKGILPQANPNHVMTTLFGWPVQQTNGLNDYGVHCPLT